MLRRLKRGTIFLSLALVACSASLPPAPASPGDDPAFAPPAPIQLAGLPGDSPIPYAILPGDILRLRVISAEPMDVPELSVDGSGRIHVPLVGDVGVGGLGLNDAEKRIEAALSKYDRFARAALSVARPAGHRAIIAGAVERPGAYAIEPGMRFAELLAVAGGPKLSRTETESYDRADLAATQIVRNGKALPVTLDRALRGDPLHNVLVRAGDIVYVPPIRHQQVTILGEVRAPKVVPFRPGIRLTEALAAAGGTTKDSDDADVRVVRGPLSNPKVYRADLASLIAGKATDVELLPGDVVFVTEHWFATATGLVGRLTPALAAAALAASFAPR